MSSENVNDENLLKNEIIEEIKNTKRLRVRAKKLLEKVDYISNEVSNFDKKAKFITIIYTIAIVLGVLAFVIGLFTSIIEI